MSRRPTLRETRWGRCDQGLGRDDPFQPTKHGAETREIGNSQEGNRFRPPRQSAPLWILLDALSEREPESVAPLRALPEISLRLRPLLLRQRLRVREPDAPSPLLDRQHQHLDLAPHRKR